MRSTDKTWDEGFVVGGSIEDSIGIVGLLIKFDQNGDSLWSNIYNGTIINLCRELPDHGFVLAGSTYVSGDDVDIILIKTDSIGNTIWSHTFGLEHIWEESYSIAELSDGGFIVGFQKTDLNWLYSGDPGILKVDNLGNQIWMKDTMEAQWMTGDVL